MNEKRELVKVVGVVIIIIVAMIVGIIMGIIGHNTFSQGNEDKAISKWTADISDCLKGDNTFGGGNGFFGKSAPILPDSEANKEYLEWKCTEKYGETPDENVDKAQRGRVLIFGIGGTIVSAAILSMALFVILETRFDD